ncbi:hypothetical protein C1645_830807, partial [Glomus cerebriforme]
MVEFLRFWQWIHSHHNTDFCTGVTVTIFQLITQNIQTSELEYLTQLIAKLLQSIKFQLIDLPLLELCVYTHRIFEATSSFSTSITDTLLGNIYRAFNQPPPPIQNNPSAQAMDSNQFNNLIQNLTQNTQQINVLAQAIQGQAQPQINAQLQAPA